MPDQNYFHALLSPKNYNARISITAHPIPICHVITSPRIERPKHSEHRHRIRDTGRARPKFNAENIIGTGCTKILKIAKI